jgi:type IX secretion system PorP/SprF family membrane protein
MKIRLIILFKCAMILASWFAATAQDAGFSQFYGNPVYLNPALAGNKINPRITLNYRNQWPSIPAQFITYSATYDQYLDALTGGVAVLFYSDQAGGGIISNNAVSGIYSYHLDASPGIIVKAGFQASFQQLSLNHDKLIFSTDPMAPIPDLQSRSRYIADFSAGTVIGFAQKYYLGLAAHHLTQPYTGFIDEPANGDFNEDLPGRQELKITIHAGAIYDLTAPAGLSGSSGVPSISPNILFQQQGVHRQMNVGAYVNLYPVVGGIWYRHNFKNHDAVTALLGLQFGNYKIGYSYDYSVSALANASGGAHEISFAWIFNHSEPQRKIRSVESPVF